MKRKINSSQNGAISVFVMVSMIFFLVTIISIYMISSKRAQTQTESVKLVQDKYYTENEEKSIYEGKIAGTSDIIPIYTKEQLWSIGENVAIEIEGKVYDFSTTDKAKYQLQNDIVMNVESDLKNSNFKDNYVFGNNTIDKNGYEVYYYYDETYYVPVRYSDTTKTTDLANGTATLSVSGDQFENVSRETTNLSGKYYLFASTNPTLASQITAENYGDEIKYSVTINGEKVSDWKVFYENDAGNIFIITSDYLKSSLVPTATGMSNDGKYSAWWENASIKLNQDAVNTLTEEGNWRDFAKGAGGEKATGSPTLEMWVASWNAKEYMQLYTRYEQKKDKDEKIIADGYYIDTKPDVTAWRVDLTGTNGWNEKLYFPNYNQKDDCWGYWLASPSVFNQNYEVTRLMRVSCTGDLGYGKFSDNMTRYKLGVRPVVQLKAGVAGRKIGDTWKID